MLELSIGLYRYYSGTYLVLDDQVVYYTNNFGLGYTSNRWRSTKAIKKLLV